MSSHILFYCLYIILLFVQHVWLWLAIYFFFLPQVVILTLLETADFDLTGQLVWPGAMLLNDYLSKNAEILQGCTIIELGSGVGKHLSKNFLPFLYKESFNQILIR